MPRYLIEGSYSDDGTKGLLQEEAVVVATRLPR